MQGIQDLLATPNNSDPAQEDAYRVFSRKNIAEYERSVAAMTGHTSTVVDAATHLLRLCNMQAGESSSTAIHQHTRLKPYMPS